MNDLIEKGKTYLAEVVIRKLIPVAIGSAVAAILGLLAAHSQLLETYGITFGIWPLSWASGQEPSGQVILIELDTLTKVGAVALTALVSALVTAISHHTMAVVNGTPQSGGMRSTDQPPAK